MIDFLLRPIRRNFGKDKKYFAAIDDMFGFIPNNIELYKLALIHKSASIVLADGQHINNERLEFLGDAVLECVSSDYLFIEYPDKNEGFLTKLRSKMVSRQMLNDVAKRIGLDEYVITHSSNNVSQKHIYGDAFEAMMGAIYLDQGYDFVNRLLINKLFVDYIKVEQLTQAETDFKSRLIEWCQKNHHTIYFDTENDKTYSSTHPFFYSKVLIDNIEMGYGAGESKKEAEQRAAYSVSQGVSDEDCTKLLDKLDSLDAQLRVRSMRQYKQRSEVTVQPEKSEPTLENPLSDSEQTNEPKQGAPAEQKQSAPAEPKPAKSRRRNRKPAAKSADNAEQVEIATTSVAEASVESVVAETPEVKEVATVADATAADAATATDTTAEVVAKKPRKRSSNRAKSAKPKTISEGVAEPAEKPAEKTTEKSTQSKKAKSAEKDNQQGAEVAPASQEEKPAKAAKKPARRRVKKSEVKPQQAEQTQAKQQEIA